MDFDDLKRAWHNCDQELNTGIVLNARGLRSALTRHSKMSANEMSRSDIDYTAPVVLVQSQLESNWIMRIARRAANWVAGACRGDEITVHFQTIVMRLFRHRLRS